MIDPGAVARARGRIEARAGVAGLEGSGFVLEVWPERPTLQRELFGALAGRVAPQAIVASTSSTISPRHPYRASEFRTRALSDDRPRAARLVEDKIARNELGPKMRRGFFDDTGERRESFETGKGRARLPWFRRP